MNELNGIIVEQDTALCQSTALILAVQHLIGL